MSKYTIGIDYGTLSGRAVLVNIENGEEVMDSVLEYPHAVMDDSIPTGEKLGLDWALQHPQDYLDVLKKTIPEVVEKSGVDIEDIIGIGIDVTACTILPVNKEGTPLCFLDEYKNRPHAYIKLWKHHAAQDLANELNEKAHELGEDWINRYGGKISSEWAIPKIWQVLKEDEEVYNASHRFIEATDWLVWKLIGEEVRSACTAGYKAIWHKKDGYPSKDFFKALDPKLENVVEEKLSENIKPTGEKAGELTKEAAEWLGLKPGTAVAVANVDAHVAAPAAKIYEAGKILAIIGTSTCHVLLGENEVEVPGMCGVVEDGIIPGFFGYEAGQPCVGDSFAWFVNNCVPEEYMYMAKKENMDIHQLLTEKARELKVGESGLLALDWWNGNRSVLVDVDLTGLILGLTLQTKPEEIYRALLESTAFGTKKIVKTFKENGVEVNEFYAAGGISQKNSLMMQIYADVLDMPVFIVDTEQGPALGSAIFAAVAAGKEAGGYDDIIEASENMGKVKEEHYTPIKENVEAYERIFNQYEELHNFFGLNSKVMKEMKSIKEETIS